jgi:hypothetical protein
MKKFAFLALTLSVFAAFTSCKKIEEPSTVNLINSAGTAVIKGIAYAETDESNAAREYAPVGTKLTIVLDPNDFPGISTSMNNDNLLLYQTTVGTNGAWEVTVKAPKAPINASIAADNFRADFTNFLGNTIEDQIWTLDGPYSVMVWDANTTIIDLQFVR